MKWILTRELDERSSYISSTWPYCLPLMWQDFVGRRVCGKNGNCKLEKNSSILQALRVLLDLSGTNWLIWNNRFLLLASAILSQRHTGLSVSHPSQQWGPTVQKERGVCQLSRTVCRFPLPRMGPDSTISSSYVHTFLELKFRKGWPPPSM